MKDRRRDVNLRQIEVFVRVYQMGSFSRAATVLELSQPTVSSHMKALEGELGVELFCRGGRTIRPTAAGDKLYAQAGRLLLLKDEVVASVLGRGGAVQGELVVGASNIPGTYLLPARIARFCGCHPAVRILLRMGDSRRVLEMVEKGEVAMGFVGMEPDPQRFDSFWFGRDHLLLAARTDHPLAGRRVSPSALKGLRCVIREKGSGTRRAADEALADLGMSLSDDLDVVLEVDSNEAAHQAVRAGVGLSFLSGLTVRGDLERGELARILVRGLAVERDFHCATFRGRPLGSVARVFLDGNTPARSAALTSPARPR